MAEVDMTTFFADGFAQGQLQFDTYAFDDLEFPQIDYCLLYTSDAADE